MKLPSCSRQALLALPMLFTAMRTALAQSQIEDPAGSGPLLSALKWIQDTLLGNLATTAAVIAVAVVGLLMLTGRMEWRRGLMVVLGAFIIFGAAAIVEGIRTVATAGH